MRVLLGEFRQESNSFNPVASSLAFWDKSGRYEGDAMRAALRGKPCAIGGMIRELEEAGEKPEIVYGVSMSCQSGGPAEQEVMDCFLERFLAAVREHSPLDAVFLSFHGALQTTMFDDAEGEVVEQVRRALGEKAVIAVSTDLHAFVSEKLLRNVDAIAGYHTYPHVDYDETGRRAARLGLAALRGADLHTACIHFPLLVSASAYNTLGGAFKEVMDYGCSLVTEGKLEDFSIYPMQPWLDVTGGASSVLAVAKDPAVAESHARDIAGKLWCSRKRFEQNQCSIDEVIDAAENQGTAKPVILVDSADSCNAGAPGDSMAVAARLLARGSKLKAATIINDSPAADLAHSLGVGRTARFKLGGSRDASAQSIEVDGYVRSLHDGEFVQEGPAGRGMVNRIGPTAVIRVGTIDVVVCHWMAGNGDPQLYRAFGVEPSLYDLVVVKACTSFRAAYGKISDSIYDTDTPGAATANLMRLRFRKLSKNFYPWVDSEEPPLERALFCRGGSC